MFMTIILALTSSATAAPHESSVVTDNQPRVVITLGPDDLSSENEIRKVKQRISGAATAVCDRSYRESYLEKAACVRTVIAKADAELGKIVSKQAAGIAAAALSVSAPPK